MNICGRLTACDLASLRCAYPSLEYDEDQHRLKGECDFIACYDGASGCLTIEGAKPDSGIRDTPQCIRDVFEIEAHLDTHRLDPVGSPRVFEVGGRIRSLANRLNLPLVDLHVYEDGAMCLALPYSQARHFSPTHMLRYLVVPFLYRIAYVERYGLEAARRELWGEYSHGLAGVAERETELAVYAASRVGRNGSCPCGGRRKFKKCCWDDVQEYRRRLRRGRLVKNL